MIPQAINNRHWNYLLALDGDAAILSRYIEFAPDNYDTYSIELGRLLMAAAAEVDVAAKLACAHVPGSGKADNILDYQRILAAARPRLPTYPVSIHRFGLALTPWSNWTVPSVPDWWTAYNKVKHERGTHFRLANLKHTLNALSALHVMLIYAFPAEASEGSLVPPSLLSIPDNAHDGWSHMGTYTTINYRL